MFYQLLCQTQEKDFNIFSVKKERSNATQMALIESYYKTIKNVKR